MMLRYDMQPHGVNSADEDLNGIAPNLATETCDVSDFIYSSTWMYRITGHAQFGDRLEKAFHNAAPAAVNRTFTGHVYFQSPNYSPRQNTGGHPGDKWDESLWHSPPCCTGNQARMLPNYIHHMWFGTPDGGLAATMYGPSTVTTMIGGTGSTGGAHNITIVSDTTYPFAQNNTITYTVLFNGASAVTFPLLLRVPSWTTLRDMKVTVNGAAVASPSLDPSLTGFIRLEQAWQGGDVVHLELPMTITATKSVTVSNGWLNMADNGGTGAHDVDGAGAGAGAGVSSKKDTRPAAERTAKRTAGGSVRDLVKAGFDTPMLGGGHMNMTAGVPFCVVERGPLVFALPLELPGGKQQPPSPAPPFNYAIECDASAMKLVGGTSMPRGAFDWPLDAPVKIAAKATRFTWPDAWVLPYVPVNGKVENQTSITLIPYVILKL